MEHLESPSLNLWLRSSPYILADEAEMQALGRALFPLLPRGAVVTLSGELGAGKSVLARALIHAGGYSGRVKSPTYTLVETYQMESVSSDFSRSHLSIAHMDLYRLADPDELHYLGFEDLLSEHDLVLIEWPEMGGDRVPPADLHLHIEYLDVGRKVSAQAPA